MFLLFSHTLTQSQETDAIYNLSVGDFISLPQDLQDLWSNISPQSDDVADYLQPIKLFLSQNAQKKDYVLIQGDFGCTYHMVDFCKQNNFIPLYSTNKRATKEIRSINENKITKISNFEHVKYRFY